MLLNDSERYCGASALDEMIMPKTHNNTGRTNKGERFVQLWHRMLRSPAWQACTANERAIYLEIAARYNGSNNGLISYSVREAAVGLRIGKSTAASALKGLEEKGFIVAVTKGAFSVKCRHATEWRLTEHWCDVSRTAASKDFMRRPNLKPGSDTDTVGT